MKDLFLGLLSVADANGNITEASMYNEGFATVYFENDNGVYHISISKQEEKEKNNG